MDEIDEEAKKYISDEVTDELGEGHQEVIDFISKMSEDYQISAKDIIKLWNEAGNPDFQRMQENLKFIAKLNTLVGEAQPVDGERSRLNQNKNGNYLQKLINTKIKNKPTRVGARKLLQENSPKSGKAREHFITEVINKMEEKKRTITYQTFERIINKVKGELNKKSSSAKKFNRKAFRLSRS